jgi:alpha-ketoglutarate-dependent taurine dioxygenase
MLVISPCLSFSSPSRAAKYRTIWTGIANSFASCSQKRSYLDIRRPQSLSRIAITRRSFSTNDTSCLPRQFLDAYDGMNFDPLTHQRNDVLFDPLNGKPPIPSTDSQSRVEIEWNPDQNEISRKECGSTSTTYSKDWIRVHEEHWRMNASDFDCSWSDVQTGVAGDAIERNDAVKRILWSNWTEDMIRDPSQSPILFEYDNLRNENQSKSDNRLLDTEKKRLLKSLYQYGLVLVTGTPTQTDSLPEQFIDPSLPKNNNSKESAESAILHLTSLIGYHPLQTLWGPGVWSTSSKSSFYNNDESNDNSASTADSAYGSTSLPLHTDMTYMASPPGVQVFLMVQPATIPDSNRDKEAILSVGQSVYLDGFAAARQLQMEDPEAFKILASTTRQYRCIDDQEGWHMEASGPVIEVLPSGFEGNILRPVKSIRHNDLDRLPDLPPYSHDNDASNEFYNCLSEAHDAWDNILRRDSMRFVISLKPGDCVLVSNQRVMHGRYAFDASYYPRVVMGCYVGIDELLSKWRTHGFRVL